MGHFEDIVPAYFCAKEDAPGESAKVIPDVEGRADRSLPRSAKGDP